MARLIPGTRLLLCALALFTGLSSASVPAAAQDNANGATGLPVPRFVSLKSDRVNVRVGPSREYEVAWTFVQSGLPVEIIQEFENWRRIRDWEGKQGWVFKSLLSGRRTALVTPWEKDNRTPLRARSRSDADIVAELEPFVLTAVSECDQGWCRVNGENYDGWLDQTRLFGVYPDEQIDD